MYSAIGYGGVSPIQVVTRLKDEYKKTLKPEISDWRTLEKSSDTKQAENKKGDNSNGIVVKGNRNILVRFAKCCNPVPGDEIIGYITKGRGVSVHRKDCLNMAQRIMKADERLIQVSWVKEHAADYQAEVQIVANDRYGLLSEITNIISVSNTTVKAINARTAKEGTAYINLTLEINDVNQLQKIIRDIKKLSGVIDVYRTKA